MTQQTKITLWIVGIIIVIAAVFFFIQNHKTVTAPTTTDDGTQVACTMDAKMCPDGSYVGRTGPNCAFAACPNSTGTSSNLMPNGNPYPADIMK